MADEELSKYVFIYPYSEAEFLLFNSFNGCLLKMPSANISEGRLLKDKLMTDDLEILYDSGFFEEEATVLSNLEQSYRTPSDQLMLNIELTGLCNLNCAYCYQKSWPKRGGMAEETMNKIAEYVERCTDLFSFRKVTIDFIGGEPFLAPAGMSHIYYRVKEICDKKGIEFRIQAETNGTLLSPAVIRDLDDLDLSVTLSLAEDHDRLRPDKQQKGTYETIVNNLLECRELIADKSIRLYLRYNVHAGNYRFFSEFLAEVQRLQLPVSTVKTAYTDEYDDNYFHNGLNEKEYKRWNSSAAIEALVQQGFPVPFFPYPSLKRCDAYQHFSCKIFFDGSVGLCNASPYGTSHLTVEEIAKDPAAINRYYEGVKTWTPLQEPDCYRCKHLVLCGGKTFCRKEPCSYYSYYLEVFLPLYVRLSERGQDAAQIIVDNC